MTRRSVRNAGGVALGVLLVLAAGCSSDSTPAASTSTVGATTTALSATTTTAASTTSSRPAAVTSSVLTSSAPTTSATSPATTSTPTVATATTVAAVTSTTVPPGAALVLRDNGLGDAAFGADPERVVATVTGVIGPPTRDSGWMDPLSLGSCPGTEVRTVTWGDLVLFFSDESRVVTGRRHFFAYTYGPAPAGSTVAPAGLQTDAGIGIGSTVTELRAAYPNVVVTPADPVAPAGFQASPALTGLLTSDQETATVTEVSGGLGCGE